METLLLVQLFHELALKGKNRPFFLKRAKAHVRRALKGLGVALEGEWPMALLFRLPEEAWPEAKARLQEHLDAALARIAEEALANPPRLALDTEYREGAEALLDDLLRN